MNKDMNEGVRLLIERMKTNPEEFDIGDGALYSSNKWGKLLNGAMSDERVFTQEERKAVQTAFLEVRRNNFTADVLRALHSEEEPVVKADWVNAGISNGTITTTGNYSLQIGNTSLNEVDLKRIKSAIGGTK
jgi:hypothetical protein